MSLIRERRKGKINPEQLTLEFLDRFEEENADIVLLRENADKVLPFLNDTKKKELERFLKTFSKLEEISSGLQDASKSIIKTSGLRISPRDFVYLYNQSGRADSEARKFLSEYRITPLELESGIKQAYSTLAQELRDRSLQVLRARGDYLFVKKIGDEKLDGSFGESRVLLPLRRIENFIVSESYKETPGEYGSDLFEQAATDAVN